MQGKGIRRARREQRAMGRAIRELRVVRWLSQEQLGFQAGLHRNYVGSVERGETNLTFRSLLAFTTGLDVSLSELVAVYERQLADGPQGR
jgi:transcriptional regulator with XRE-family HTH domain